MIDIPNEIQKALIIFYGNNDLVTAESNNKEAREYIKILIFGRNNLLISEPKDKKSLEYTKIGNFDSLYLVNVSYRTFLRDSRIILSYLRFSDRHITKIIPMIWRYYVRIMQYIYFKFFVI